MFKYVPIMSDDFINSKYGGTDSHWFIPAVSMVKLMQSSTLIGSYTAQGLEDSKAAPPKN